MSQHTVSPTFHGPPGLLVKDTLRSKGYWIGAYRAVSDPEVLVEYSKLAGPAVIRAGGRFLVRGPADYVHEAGIKERMVIVEFESLDKVIAARASPEYQAALAVLGDTAERDVRIV
jgi:uncharacterized protein (DUF1330 family)